MSRAPTVLLTRSFAMGWHGEHSIQSMSNQTLPEVEAECWAGGVGGTSITFRQPSIGSLRMSVRVVARQTGSSVVREGEIGVFYLVGD